MHERYMNYYEFSVSWFNRVEVQEARACCNAFSEKDATFLVLSKMPYTYKDISLEKTGEYDHEIRQNVKYTYFTVDKLSGELKEHCELY